METTNVVIQLRGVYSRIHLGQPGHGMWVENSDGEVLLGQVMPGFSYADREQAKFKHLVKDGVRIWEFQGYTYFAVYQVPVQFKEGPAFLCNVFFNDKTPPLKNIFYHGCILLLLVGGFFSFWIARQVSWPLRRLQNEVMNIKANHPDSLVTESGEDEVGQVARSINTLTRKLNLHISNRDDMIANVSHELRSPLARVSILLTLMQERLISLKAYLSSLPQVKDRQAVACVRMPNHPGAMVQRDGNAESCSLESFFTNQLIDLDGFLERLHEEYRTMDGLIDTVLLSERLSGDHVSVVLQRLDLSRLCADEFVRNKVLFEKVNIRITVRLMKSVYIMGDFALLQALCTNLLVNAAKYTEPGGAVVFGLEKDREEAVLQICNTHPYIAEEKLERFFEPFYRAGVVTGNGVGLGLSLVKKICLRHNATVHVRNCVCMGKPGICLTIRFRLA